MTAVEDLLFYDSRGEKVFRFSDVRVVLEVDEYIQALIPRVEALIKAAKAEAWDEGVRVAWIAALNGDRCGDNPYR